MEDSGKTLTNSPVVPSPVQKLSASPVRRARNSLSPFRRDYVSTEVSSCRKVMELRTIRNSWDSNNANARRDSALVKCERMTKQQHVQKLGGIKASSVITSAPRPVTSTSASICKRGAPTKDTYDDSIVSKPVNRMKKLLLKPVPTTKYRSSSDSRVPFAFCLHLLVFRSFTRQFIYPIIYFHFSVSMYLSITLFVLYKYVRL